MFKTAELARIYLKDKYLYQMSSLVYSSSGCNNLGIVQMLCMYTFIDNFSNVMHVHMHIHYSLPWQLREVPGNTFLINVQKTFLNTEQDN